jgi:hypothetical protein
MISPHRRELFAVGQPGIGVPGRAGAPRSPIPNPQDLKMTFGMRGRGKSLRQPGTSAHGQDEALVGHRQKLGACLYVVEQALLQLQQYQIQDLQQIPVGSFGQLLRQRRFRAHLIGIVRILWGAKTLICRRISPPIPSQPCSNRLPIRSCAPFFGFSPTRT